MQLKFASLFLALVTLISYNRCIDATPIPNKLADAKALSVNNKTLTPQESNSNLTALFNELTPQDGKEINMAKAIEALAVMIDKENNHPSKDHEEIESFFKEEPKIIEELKKDVDKEIQHSGADKDSKKSLVNLSQSLEHLYKSTQSEKI